MRHPERRTHSGARPQAIQTPLARRVVSRPDHGPSGCLVIPPKEDNVNPSSEVVAPQSLVTEGNVQAALVADKGAKARLTAWKVVDFTKKGDNYLCVVSSVEVQYEMEGQSSKVVYVVKLNSLRNCENTEVLNEFIFEREGNVYSILIPELNSVLKKIGEREISFPRCLHVNLEKGKEIIFLEDLRARGYKMFDRKRGMDGAHVNLVLRELARLHAASLLLQNKYPVEDLREKHPYLKKEIYDLMQTSDSVLHIFKNSLKFSRDILEKMGGYERVVAWIDTLIPKLVDILYKQLEYGKPKVVCHGDCWNNNLLFRYDEYGHPVDVMLLDLQVVRYTTPAIDLNYFIYLSMTGDVRKSNLQSLLDCYHEALINIMEVAGQEAPFTREHLLKDFRDKNLFGAIYGMTIIPVVIFESEDVLVSSKNSDETIEGMFSNAREKLKDTLDTNPIVKPRFLSLFTEMMEVGLIP